MGYFELFIIGIGLSTDAFSAAVCRGLSLRKADFGHTFTIAAFFGGFQALMPLIGWFLGKQFEKYITEFDHWIAFVLLAFIGGKMLYDAVRGSNDEYLCNSLKINEIALMAVATSIDALAVGVTFAFLLKNSEIFAAASIIGVTTFVLSGLGVIIGAFFGSKYKKTAQIFGGAVLILMGIKILAEHLNPASL